MGEWDLEDMLDWQDEEDYEDVISRLSAELAGLYFLSDNEVHPAAGDAYDLGRLADEDWWPLVRQLDDLLEWETVLELSDSVRALVPLPGLPTALLEAPLDFLEGVLVGALPRDASGRKLSPTRLLKIAKGIVSIAQELPDTAQAAVRAWADVHRSQLGTYAEQDEEDLDLSGLLATRDLPAALAGFSMLIAMTLMRWPDRAEGLSLPTEFLDPDLLLATLGEWEALPDAPAVTDEGSGDAETLFAQGQLAHTLAQMSPAGELGLLPAHDGEAGLAFSRLSRAILWVHHHCRHCPERDGVGCQAVSSGEQGEPAPLLDIAGEMANEGRIEGCTMM